LWELRIGNIKKGGFHKMSKKGMVSLLAVILSVVFIVSMVRLIDTVSIGNIPAAKVVFCSAPPPPAGELGNLDIFSAELDRHDWIKPENWKRLTNEQTWEVNPKWSPDGTKIAFESYDPKNVLDKDIFVMDSDGKNKVNVSNNPGLPDQEPAWSPDGKKIAFYSLRDNNNCIYVVNSDGNNLKLLIAENHVMGHPSWSPDGTKIVFVKTEGTYVMDADGKAQTIIAKMLPHYDFYPEWSPDGTKIAFCSNRDGDLEIYTMDPDGSNQKRLTYDPGDDVFPIWTSDGRIVYRSNITGYMIMDSDGSNQQLLVDGGLSGINWLGPGVVSVEPMGKLKTMWGKIKSK
jgi:Tol biopolymer transport system component